VEDVAFAFRINLVSVPIFLALAIAVALFARHVSGGWMRPWLNIKPVFWLPLLFLLPWIGLPVLVVSLFVHRNAPGAIARRNAAG